ncbi:MAG: DUF881 domain-containing protein [Nocardioidaceae bacterium]
MSDADGADEALPTAHPAAAAPTRYVGLLTQVMTNTLDEDYQVVAQRKRGDTRRPRRHQGIWVVCIIFGLMVGVSILKTERGKPEAALQRQQLVNGIHTRADRLTDLHTDLSRVQAQVTRLQQSAATAATRAHQLSTQMQALQMSAGTIGVTGPGVVVTVDNAAASLGSGNGGVILDKDLQALANGLWASGAEAISINGRRLTSLSAIRKAGQAITVNYRSLTPPYVVTAVGNPDTLPAKFLETAGGQAWQALHANFGIRFNIVANGNVTVPGAPHPLLTYARAEASR